MTWSKNWCQGFCCSCGTACGEYCENIHGLHNERTELMVENAKLRETLRMCASQAGNPDPAEGCRLIITTVKEALRRGSIP